MSVTANELNLAEVSGYSSSEEVQSISEFNSTQLAVTNSRVDGLEARINNFEAGSFSETTTATFSADFAIGAVDGDTSEDAIQGLYGFQIDLNTSFTGDDSFDVSIDAGNGNNGLTELDLNDVGASGTTNDDVLAVDGISYTFPVGDNLTVLVGNDVAGSSLYNTACVYGGITNTLDDCGNASSAMDGNGATALSASYDFGDGFTAAFGYEGVGDGANGLMTKEGLDTYGLQVSYAEEDGQFGGSLTYALQETSSAAETTYWALNGYWTPEDVGAVPSISVGYEVGNPSGSSNDTTHWFLGFQWDEVGDGTLGAAVGTDKHYADNVTEYLMYEAFYSYPINDGMTVTPVIYVKETSGDDQTGVMVKTSFSF
jgi:hypothetical protein